MSSDGPLLSRILARIVDPKASVSVGRGRTIAPSHSGDVQPVAPLRLRIHVTFFVLLVAEVLMSLRYASSYPAFILLTALVYGPILLTTALVHECGHACAARSLGGRIDPRDVVGEDAGRGEGSIVLWPLGGFTFCEPPAGGGVRADLLIALAGPFMHVPMGLTWAMLYLALHGGDIAEFSLRTDLEALSSDMVGFCSTLFEQGVLLNVFLLWFNVFVPAFPLDGGRIMASSMTLLGVALDKTALLASVTSFVVGLALLAWSAMSFFDGIGNVGVFAFLAATFVVASASHLFLAVKDRKIRQNSLYGRECYYINGTTPLPLGSMHRPVNMNVQVIGVSDPETGIGDDTATLMTDAISDAQGSS